MNIVKSRKYWYIIALLLISVACSLLESRVSIPIDYTGGSLIELSLSAVEISDVRAVLNDGPCQDSRVQESEGNVIMIRTSALSQEEAEHYCRG